MSDKSLGEHAYEQFADRYAAKVGSKPHNAHYDRPATLSLLPGGTNLTGLRVLDAGAGPGEYAAVLKQRGARVTACDVTPRFVEIMKKRFGDTVAVHRADLRHRLKFAEDASFDGVVCALVLSYLPDWGPVMAEFGRVLKPGGWLVVSTSHPMGDWDLSQRLTPGGDYFQRESMSMDWSGFGTPRPTVTSFRRSLMETLNPVLEAGLTLERVLEPRPTKAFAHADPGNYAVLCRMPGFLMFRARRPVQVAS